MKKSVGGNAYPLMWKEHRREEIGGEEDDESGRGGNALPCRPEPCGKDLS